MLAENLPEFARWPCHIRNAMHASSFMLRAGPIAALASTFGLSDGMHCDAVRSSELRSLWVSGWAGTQEPHRSVFFFAVWCGQTNFWATLHLHVKHLASSSYSCFAHLPQDLSRKRLLDAGDKRGTCSGFSETVSERYRLHLSDL